MAISAARDPVESRFATGVELVRRHMTGLGVAIGSYAELQSVANQLQTSDSFHREMTAALRKVIETGAGTLTRMELLDLLCIAVGGSSVSPAEQPVPQAVRQLLVFVNEVLLTAQRPAFMGKMAVQDRQEPDTHESKTSAHHSRSLQALKPGTSERDSQPFSTGSLSGPSDETGELRSRDLPAPWTSFGRSPERVSRSFGAVSEIASQENDGWQLDRLEEAQTSRASDSPGGGPSFWNAGLLSRQAAWIAGAAFAGFALGAVTVHRRVTATEKADPVSSPAPRESIVQPAARSPDMEGGANEPTVAVASDAAMSHVLYASPPNYPTLARLTGVEGEVLVKATISPLGFVVDTQILEGNALLRNEAERAVRRWRFRPYRANGRPVQIQANIPVTFRLQP